MFHLVCLKLMTATMKVGGKEHLVSTLIIVDRIGEGSRITDMANEIGGDIVQMSMSFWVKQVAKILQRTTGFDHEILRITDNNSLKYIKNSIAKVELRDFI